MDARSRRRAAAARGLPPPEPLVLIATLRAVFSGALLPREDRVHPLPVAAIATLDAMPPGDAARLLHRLTSYEPGRDWDRPIDDPRIRQDVTPNDPATWPAPYKRYPGALTRLELSRDPPPGELTATQALAGAPAGSSARLDRDAIGRLLFLSAGVVRITRRRDGGRLLLRAAGSAGARFPLELYVAARGVDGMPDGVHWYDPEAHALVAVGPPPTEGTTTVVVTGVPWRTGWRYAERGYRHVHWDAGTMLSQFLAAAASAGIPVRLRTRFPDTPVTRLTGADGVHEFPVAVVTLGDGVPALSPRDAAVPGEVDAAPVELPLVTSAQRAGDADDLGAPWPEGEPLPGDPPAAATLDDVVLRRGSTRRLRRGASVPREQLEWAMRASLRGIAVPHFVAAHAVDGLEPGLYRWPDLTRPVRTGDLRDQLCRICLDQGLAGDASYVVLGAADLDALDDRGYREAQLAAGIVEGRLHLAAFADGLGASGMTFLDSEIEQLLGEPLSGLLFTCVGVPEYANRAGGAPGRPTAVRVPTPR